MEGGRLSRIEAERIIAILDDTAEKLEFLDSITPDLLQHRDELSKFIGNEISKTMTEQKLLEKRYEELIENRASMKGMTNKNKYKAVQEEIQGVSRALRESTNNLVRNLKENPNVSGNLIKVQRDRSELHDLITRCGQELRDRATYQTIATRVAEYKKISLRFMTLQSKEEDNVITLAALQEKLADEQRSYAHITAQQKGAIGHLKNELAVIRGSTSTDSKFKKKSDLANVSAVYREFKLQERALEEKVRSMEEKLHTELLVHNESKDFILRKHIITTNTINNWQIKHEADVGELDEDIRILIYRRKKLLDELCLLQNRKRLQILKDIKDKENENIERLKVGENEVLLKKQNRAAKVIVREIRAYVKLKTLLDAFKGKGKKDNKEKKEKEEGKKSQKK